jgi:uroporphyrinogen-III synthase
VIVRLLVTRPEPDGARTAAKLRERGHDVLIAPLLHVKALAADLGEGPWGAVVMTSANAARAIGRHPRLPELAGLPVFVVGRRTGEVARALGLGDVTSADGNERDLERLIAARLRGSAAPLLYLAGEDRAADLAGDLGAHGLRVHIVAVYRATKATRFPLAAEAALAAGGLDGVLHYSRRSAQAYIDCAQAAEILDRALVPFHGCLSALVAEPLLAAGAADIRVAIRPEEAALLELI